MALRHPHQGFRVGVVEPPAQPVAEAHSVDALLDNGFDVDGCLGKGAAGDASSARLVARVLRAVQEQDADAGPRQIDRGGAAGGPSARDDDVVISHEGQSNNRAE